MLISGVVILCVNVCCFILTSIYNYNSLSALFVILIILYSEYNLKFKVLTFCAGYCTTFAFKVKEYIETNCAHLSYQKTNSVFASTPIMQRQNSSGIFRTDSMLSPILKADRNEENGLNFSKSPKSYNTPLRTGRLSRYSLSDDVGSSRSCSPRVTNMAGSPQLRSRAAGIKTTQTVAGPLLASTRHKIDSHLYTDVNSPGLTTRIVQYNESFVDEKPTIEPRYKGVGQFPIVNLNKTPVRQIPLKVSAVKIRIAPPDFSSYTSDRRMQMFTTEQHRPLLPSPIQEPPGPPTKSVLEALKEISRKRIHTQDDAEYSYEDDISKRQRKESLSKGTAGPSPFTRPPISKRPRDDEQRDYLDGGALFNRPLGNENGFKCWRPKKRQRNESMKCNDILSSLSSSRHLQRENSKRKVDMSPKDDVKHMKLTVQNVSQISISSEDYIEENGAVNVPKTSETPEQDERSLTSPVVSSKSKESPRITLFNKALPQGINKSKDSVAEESDDNGYETMPFVKPRKKSISNSVGTMNYTERCKLSQMLSCLSDKNGLEDFHVSRDVSTSVSTISTSNLLSDDNKLNTPNTKTTINTTTVTTESYGKPVVASKVLETPTSSLGITFNTSSGNSTAIGTSSSGIVSNAKLTSTSTEGSKINGSPTPFSITSSAAQSTIVALSSNSINSVTTSSTNQTKPLELNTESKLTSPSLIFGATAPLSKTSVSTSQPEVYVPNTKSVVNTPSKLGGFNLLAKSSSDSVATANFISPATASTTSISTPSFAFGIQTGQTTAPATEALSSKPIFSLGASNASKMTSQSDSSKGGFHFDLNKVVNDADKKNVTSPILGTVNASPKTSFTPSLGFLNPKSGVGTLSGNSLTNSPSKLSIQGFTNTAQSNVLGFQTSTAQNQNLFGNTNNPVLGVTLGNPSSTATTNSQSALNNTVTSTPSPFTFNMNANNAKSTAASFLFGNNTTTFSSPATSSTITAGPESSKITNANITSVASIVFTPTQSVFGPNKNTTSTFDASKSSCVDSSKKSSVPGIVPFGVTSSATSIFGTPATTSGGFNFGSTNTTTKPLFNAPTSTLTTNNVTPFGIPNPTPPTTTNFTTPATFAPTTKSSIFGTPAVNSTIFGSTKPSVFGAPTTTSSFAAPVNTPIFGGATNLPPAFGSAPTPAFGVPATTTSVLPFGMNTTTNVPAFQANSATPAFGVVSPNTQTQTAPNAFGSLNSSAGFGTTGTTPAFGVKTVPSAFNPPTTTTNAFGNPAQMPSQNSAFGSSTATEKSVFTFGGSNTAQSATPFNFGAQSSVSKAFNFGAAPSVPAFGANVQSNPPTFGDANSSFGAPTQSGSMNQPFGNQLQTNFGSPSPAFGANPTGSMFSIGAGGGTKSRVRTRRQR